MSLIVIILILLLVFGGGSYGYRSGWGHGEFGGLFGIVLVILVILYLTGNLGHLR